MTAQELIEKIINALKDVDEKIESLRNKVNGILDWVPWGLGWVVDKFKSLWNKAMDKLDEFWKVVSPITGAFGEPWDISSAQDDWNTVGSNVSAEAITATDGELTVDNNWTGKAADAYKSALGNQKGAITAIKSTFTDKISPALSAMASALYTFYIGVGIAVAAMVLGIVCATGEAVSILGLPAVPPTVIVAIGTALIAVGKTGFDLKTAASNADAVFITLQTENTAFGRDNWPKAAF